MAVVAPITPEPVDSEKPSQFPNEWVALCYNHEWHHARKFVRAARETFHLCEVLATTTISYGYVPVLDDMREEWIVMQRKQLADYFTLSWEEAFAKYGDSRITSSEVSNNV